MPLAVRLPQILSRPPACLAASVLKTAFLKPGGHESEDGGGLAGGTEGPGALELEFDDVVWFRKGPEAGVASLATALGAGRVGGAAYGTATGVAILPAASIKSRYVRDNIFGK